MTLDKLIDGVTALVSLPDIYHKLEQTIADPNSGLDDVANLISLDPDLTLRIMGIANSSLFGFPAKVETVNRAVTLIGTQQLRDIVLTTIVVKQLRQFEVELLDMACFWRHSLATGVLARAIAIWRRERNVERYYALGLLHDIGKLLLCMRMPDEMVTVQQICQQRACSQHIAERDVLGFDHAEVVGALFSSVWQLDESLSVVAMYHHQPMTAGEWTVDASIIHTADVMANALNWDGCGQSLVPMLNDSAWLSLDLVDTALPEIVERAHPQYADAIRLLLE